MSHASNSEVHRAPKISVNQSRENKKRRVKKKVRSHGGDEVVLKRLRAFFEYHIEKEKCELKRVDDTICLLIRNGGVLQAFLIMIREKRHEDLYMYVCGE